MDNFYEIMEVIYRFNQKYPEIRFGQLIHNLFTKDDRLFYISNDELLKRLKIILEEIDP